MLPEAQRRPQGRTPAIDVEQHRAPARPGPSSAKVGAELGKRVCGPTSARCGATSAPCFVGFGPRSVKVWAIGQTWWISTPEFGRLGRTLFGPRLGDFGLLVDTRRCNSATNGPNQPTLAESGQLWPASPQIWYWATSDRVRPNLAELGPGLTELGPEVGSTSMGIGPGLVGVGQKWPILVNFGARSIGPLHTGGGRRAARRRW